ncbi:MAG: hypothetical protein WCE54_16140 [Ignavibacteriaceae bacterium]
MPEIIKCCHCREKVKANPRLKGNQEYCSKDDCQRARKRLSKQERTNRDELFRKKQIEYGKQWRKEKPSHKYMAQYRRDHPDYVQKNRQKQKKRNETRRHREKTAKIVKVDTLLATPRKTKTYQMTSFSRDSSGKIVKVDTLMVQLKQIQSLNSGERAFGG